jgi:DNA polymerase
MLEFLDTEGVKTDNLKKSTVDKLLKGVVDSDTARELLEIRKMFAKASTAKLKAMRRGVCADGRIRDLLAYLGADTWRWAGRRVQTQNLVRLPKGFDVDEALEWIHDPNAEALLSGWYGSILEVVSWLLRPMIIAAPGKKLMGGDYANIEGRVLAWAAGEEWKLQAFREYDAGTGPDIYKLTYARSFKIAIDLVDEIMRQIGKVEELALGYQGALNAFRSMALNYGIIVIADHEPRPADGAVLTESEVLEIVEAWRNAHPATCGERWTDNQGYKRARKGGLWNNLYDAALSAIQNPGKLYEAGPVVYRAYGDFLKCRLPSGRTLSYPFPSAEFKTNKWGKEQWIIETWGTDSKKGGKRWQSREPYGGLFAENITQAIARDLLAFAQPRLEVAGYPVVMHGHDEIICEVDEDFGDPKEFAALMCELPPWAKGLPVTVGKPWQGKRYLK